MNIDNRIIEKKDLRYYAEKLFGILPKTEIICTEGFLSSGITLFTFESVPYTLRNLSNTTVYAAIGIPDATDFPVPEGGYPAVVLIHGGAGQIYPEWIRYWTEKGYIALAPDMYANALVVKDGKIVKVTNPLGGPDESRTGSLNDDCFNPKDSWMYHSIATVILTNNLLRARKDINRNKIGLTGISWGGVVTCVAAGIDKRFSAYAPVYGCGYLYEDSKWYGNKFSDGHKSEWIQLFDPSSYMPFSEKPILFVSGIDDNCFSVINRAKSYALIKRQAYFSQRSDLPHGYLWFRTYEIYAFFECFLCGKDIFPTIGTVQYNSDTVTYLGNGLETGVNVCYTVSDNKDSHEWFFKKEKLTGKEREYSFVLPLQTKVLVFETQYKNMNPDFRLTTPLMFL